MLAHIHYAKNVTSDITVLAMSSSHIGEEGTEGFEASVLRTRALGMGAGC